MSGHELDRLRVCHIITKLELGGAQQNTLYTVGHLDPKAFEVQLIAGPGGLLDEQARDLDIHFETAPHLVRRIRPFHDLRALWDLTRRLRRLKPTVVHTHSSKAGIVGRLAARLAGVPVIIHTVHGWGFHTGLTRRRWKMFVMLEKLAARCTTQWVAVSEANARDGESAGIAPARDFEIIYSGVELSAFRHAVDNGALRRELGLGEDVPLVGMIACLKPQKSPEHFVQLAERVVRHVPNAHFVLAGDGELRDAVEAAVHRSGLEQHVTLLGWRKDPELIVGDLDVLVLTSRHEGLPRVVPEAMAAGKPVVATAVDGTPEAVLHDQTGFLRPFGDVDGLAEDVVTLLNDESRRRRFGEAGRAHAQSWDIDEMVRAQERLYQRLSSPQATPQPVDVGEHVRKAAP